MKMTKDDIPIIQPPRQQSTCSDGTCGSEDRLPPGMLAQYDLDADISDGALIWIEIVHDAVDPTAYEIAGHFRGLDIGRMFGIVFGNASLRERYDEMFEYGIDTLYHIRSPSLDVFNSDVYAKQFVNVAERIRPAIIAIPSSVNGKELAEKVASLIGTETDAIDGNEIKSVPKITVISEGTYGMPERMVGRKGTAINIQY